MVLALIYNPDTGQTLLKSASKLAIQLGKEFGVLSFVDSTEQIVGREKELKELLPETTIWVRDSKLLNSKPFARSWMLHYCLFNFLMQALFAAI